MKRMTAALLVAGSLALQGFSGCKSPTAEFDHLREASALAVSSTNTLEVLE